MTNPTTGAYGDGMESVAAAVSGLVEDIFGALDRIATATAGLWDRMGANGIPVRSTDLTELRDAVLAELAARRSLFHGAGLVMADGALADRPRHLEWWSAGGAEPHRESFDLNPNSDYFYDYTAMEWFVAPRDRGTRWVAGPYLDYTGVDLYVCTFAVPVTAADGTFLGIAGADVTLAALDAALMPALRSSGAAMALVNQEGRVIVANHADHVTGSRLRRAQIDAGQPVAGTQWTQVALDTSHVHRG